MVNIFRLFCIFAMCLGLIGFAAIWVLPSFDGSLRTVEFPAILETKTIRGSDGQLYAVIEPLNRIQRYNQNGEFQLGWFVDAAGGLIAVGLTENNEVISVSARRDHIELFSSSGVRLKSPMEYKQPVGLRFPTTPLRSEDLKSRELFVTESALIENPKLSKQASLLIIFVHPFVAWIIFIIGNMGFFLERKFRQKTAK